MFCSVPLRALCGEYLRCIPCRLNPSWVRRARARSHHCGFLQRIVGLNENRAVGPYPDFQSATLNPMKPKMLRRLLQFFAQYFVMALKVY
jgi:hypothetical protein